ncbi:hypothetical protein C6501_06130 [Candidatus Poribacteria bacterium]|nr:MAG: hypothetical protein C6501_06130 [Candidatus Poribacteria bacterium]
MPTIKEREEQTVKKQLNLGVRDLIKSMNSASDLIITIAENDPTDTWFDILLEYEPYEDSPQKFQRHVSNLEVEGFISNVFSNIEGLIG